MTGKKEVILSSQRKGSDVVGHRGPVMALAVSSDGKYMVRNEETFSLEKRQFEITNLQSLRTLQKRFIVFIRIKKEL